MERRRFILDAITHAPSQSIADELSDLRYSHTGLNGSGSSVANEDQMSREELTSESRTKRAVARKHKLEALKSRHQVEVRFQALEKIFERNGTIKVPRYLGVTQVRRAHDANYLHVGTNTQDGALKASSEPSPSLTIVDPKLRRAYSKSEVEVPSTAGRQLARHHQLQPVAAAQWTDGGDKRNLIR